MTSSVEQGRAAFALGDWAEAYRAFATAAENAPLDAADHEQLAVSAYLVGEDDVDEDQIPKSNKVGETGNVNAGKTKAITLKLSAGSYILFCNIIDTEPDGSQISHFAKVMYTTINAS